MGTETEINPTRQPSQKPGIRFSLKGRKRPLCRACQTAMAHTLHMAMNVPPFMHTYMYMHIALHIFPTHAGFIHVHTQALMPMQAFRCASDTEVHICRFMVCTYALSRTHSPNG